MVVGFVIGTASLIFVGGEAGRDAWAAILGGIIEGALLCVPFLLLSTRFLGMGVSAINDRVWGNYVGKFFTLAFIGYTLLLSSTVVTNFFDFVQLVVLNGIPDYPLNIPTSIVLAIAALFGVEVLSLFMSITVPLVIVFIVFVSLLSIPYIDLNNIRPILGTPLPKMLQIIHNVATFPIAEVVAFSAILPCLSKPQKALKNTFTGISVAAFVLMFITVRNSGMLGDSTGYFAYPSFTSARVINVAGVFTRMELIVSINLILLSGIKAAILLYVASVTTVEMLKLKSLRTAVIPFSILIASINHNNFPSVAHNFVYATKVYPLYALLFQFVLPLLTLVVAIVLKKSLNSKISS